MSDLYSPETRARYENLKNELAALYAETRPAMEADKAPGSWGRRADAIDAEIVERYGEPDHVCHPYPATGFARNATWEIDGCRIRRWEDRIVVYIGTTEEANRPVYFARSTGRDEDAESERRQMGLTD